VSDAAEKPTNNFLDIFLLAEFYFWLLPLPMIRRWQVYVRKYERKWFGTVNFRFVGLTED